MNKILLTIVFLLATWVAKAQDLNAFTVQAIQGQCYSDSKIKITAPTGFPVTSLTVELQEPIVEGGTPTPPKIQEFDAAEYTFESLKPGVYTVTIINENGWIRSDAKTVTVTSTYKTIEITKLAAKAPSCGNNNDGKITFEIKAGTGKGPDFAISITRSDGTIVVPAQTFTRASASQALQVEIQGNATNPLTSGQVLINIQDMTGGVANCEIRREPVSIPQTNLDVDCIEIFKWDDYSRIQTNDECKHRITFRIHRKDEGDISPVISYINNNPTGLVIVKRIKRDSSGNIISETEYDITSTFRNQMEFVAEYNSFVSDYVFEDGDEVELTINIGKTPVKERFVLGGMNPATNTTSDFWESVGSKGLGFGNQSYMSCASDDIIVYMAPYWVKQEFTNLDNAADPAGYHRYEWYQDLSNVLTEDEVYNQGKKGYYFELYKWTGSGTPPVGDSPYWQRHTQMPIPPTHPLYTSHVSGKIQWLDQSSSGSRVDVKNAGIGWYKVVYRNNSGQTSSPGDDCYRPARIGWFEPKETNISDFFKHFEINQGVFDGTVSFRKWIGPNSFIYPLTVTLKPSGVTIPTGGTHTMTFDTSLPFDEGVTHQRSIGFPFVRVITDSESVNGNISFGDFPAGYYDMTVTDGCGKVATRDNINFDTPVNYQNDFVRVEYLCRNANVHFNIGDNLNLGTVRYLWTNLYKKNASGQWVRVKYSTKRIPSSGSVSLSDVFENLEAGEYKIQVLNLAYARIKRTVWANPNTFEDVSGRGESVVGYTLIPEFQQYLRPEIQELFRGASTQIYNEKIFTIRDTYPLDVDITGTSCDATAGRGMVIVNIANQQDIRYPLKFTLYREVTPGNNVFVNEVSYNEASGAKSHIFTGLQDGKYHVKVEHLCTTSDYETTVTANTYAKPVIRSVAESKNPCNGDTVRLVFSGSDVLFNIEWFRIEADGTRTSVGTGKTITQTITATTNFVAEYRLKTLGTVCGDTLGVTDQHQVSFVADTTPPAITGCPSNPIVVNAATGKCSAVVSWGTVTATDTCGWTHTQTHQSGDTFEIGVHTVTYVFTDTSGNTSTCTFNVEVKSNALNVDVNSSYIDGTGALLTQNLVLNQQFQYKIEYQNVGQEAVTTSTLTITFTDNPYINIGAPVLTNATVGTFSPTYTKVGRTYTFVLPKETLQGNSSKRTIYFPIEVSGTYAEIGQPCMNYLKTSYVFEYEGGNENCSIPKQTKIGSNKALISTENDQRSELFCAGSTLLLTATTGFDSYKWYKDGTLISGATTNSYNATAAGVYKVEKTIVCNGETLVSTETIKFQEYASIPDPIRSQASGGAVCGADGRWTSHFILCNEPSRVITVDFVNTQLEWQRFTCALPTDRKCQNYNESCWETLSSVTGNTFVANTAGRYRLKATSSNGCEAFYYFEVFVNALAGEIETPVGHITSYQPGHFTIRMVTEGVTYLYTVRNAANQILSGFNQVSGNHVFRVSGISDPGVYTVEVTSPNLGTCSTLLTTEIQKRTELTATATLKSWTDCNNLTVRFEAQGGQAPYEFAVWKIDGVQRYADYTSIPASAFNIATIPSGSSFVETQVNITQPGKYIFVTKDQNGAYAETPAVDIYPDGVNGYTINTTDIICGAATNSGRVSVVFNSALQNITTRLYKLNSSGVRVQTYEPNSTGFYEGLEAGKYELEIRIRKSASNICLYTSPLEIYQKENTLKAFAGVVEDKSCDVVNTPQKYKVHINNVSGGSGTGYTYSADGVNYTPSNILYLSNSGTVYVKDSNGCPLQISVNIAALAQPTVSVSPVQYNCVGKGTFTVTASPAGDYEYEVVGGSVNERKTSNVFTLSEGTYTVYVHYKPGSTSATTPNYLFKEDFGTGDDTCDNSITYMTCKPEDVLESSQYVITKQVKSRSEWVSPTPVDASGVASGRYLAVNANSNQGNLAIIYKKDIKNVVVGRDLKVSLKLHNLLSPTYVGGKNPNIDLLIVSSSGIELENIGLGQILATGNWESKSVTFAGTNITTSDIIFQIRNREQTSANAGSDVAVDDIVIWQDTKLCDVRLESSSVAVVAGKGFNVVGTPEDATCGNLGKLHLKIENRNGSSLEYSKDNATWSALTLVPVSATEDRATITNLPQVTNGVLYVRKQNDATCVEEITYTLRAPETVSITTAVLRAVTCDDLTADVKMSATGGVRPYQLFSAIGGSIVKSVNAVNNEAVFAGSDALPAGTYEIQVVDAKGCVTTSTLEIKDKVDLQLEVQNDILCFSGGTEGTIQVNVLQGNGNYKFSKDGVNFFSSPIANGGYYIFENLSAGNYTFTVKDGANCVKTISTTIYEPLRLYVPAATNLTCATGSTAQYTLRAMGGDTTKVKEFLWSNDGVNFTTSTVSGITLTTSGNTATFTTSVEGTYYFKVRYKVDAYDYCEATSAKQVVEVKEPRFVVAPTTESVKCNGSETGSILVSVANIAGGRSPYALLLFDGTTTTTHSVGNITGLAGGTYTLTILDADGCLSEATSVVIDEVPALAVSVTTQAVHCNAGVGMELGKATFDFVSGGVGPFTLQVRYKDVPAASPIHTANYAIGDVYTITGLNPHDYTYVITDGNNCKTVGGFTVAGTSDRLITDATVIAASCVSATLQVDAYNDGGNTIASGSHWVALYSLGMPLPTGTPPVSSLTIWNSGGVTWYRASTATVTTHAGTQVSGIRGVVEDLVPGARYKFIVYDHSTGCYIIEEANDEPLAQSTLSSTITTVKTTCSSSNDGQVMVSLTGHDASTTNISYQLYDYAYNTAVIGKTGTVAVTGLVNTLTVTGLNAGKYYFVFTENNTTCQKASLPFVIEKALTKLVIEKITTNNDTCHRGEGKIAIQAKDGQTPYKYYYHSLATPALAIGSSALESAFAASSDGASKNVAAGDWIVYVRDANGCVEATQTITVEMDSQPVISATKVENACSDEAFYSVRLYLSSVGTGQHSYRVVGKSDWRNIDVSAYTTSTVLPTQFEASTVTYTIELKDGNNCITSTYVRVYQPITYEVRSDARTCGTTTATITISNITGGSGSYFYSIDKVVPVQIDEFTWGETMIPVTSVVTATGSVINVVVGVATGTVSVEGNYRVNIYDQMTYGTSDACPKTKLLTIDEPVKPQVEVISVTQPNCGTGVGSVRVKASPNTLTPYSFAIIGGSASITTTGADYATFENLAGSTSGITYILQATSANGCTATTSVTITTPPDLTIQSGALTLAPYQCGSNGLPVMPSLSFDLTKVSGGTQSYTRVEFYDVSTTVPVSTQYITEGVTTYTYTLSEHLSVIKTYNVKVYDANGCDQVSTPNVTVTPTLILSRVDAVEAVEITCLNGAEDVSVTLSTTTTYGGETIEYVVMKRDVNGQESQIDIRTVASLTTTFSLPVGNYTLIARNPLTGCEVKTTYDVLSPESFMLTTSNIKNVLCYGEATGEVTLTFTDTRLTDGDHAASGFSYVVSPITGSSGSTVTGTVAGSTVVTVSGLLAGNYQVEATSLANGCKTNISFEITQSEQPLSAVATETYGVTCSNNRGEVLVTVSGGKAPYQVILVPADGSAAHFKTVGDAVTNSAQVLFTGLKSDEITGSLSYSVRVVDNSGAGCDKAGLATVTLAYPTAITATATVTQNVTCLGANNGIITISNVSGGSGAGTYNYVLEGTYTIVTQSSPVFENLAPGTYKVSITDAWECDKLIATLSITEPLALEFKRVNAELTVCYGESTAWMSFEVKGGTAPYKVDFVRAETQAVVYSIPAVYTADVIPPSLRAGSYEVHITDANGCTMSPVYQFEVEGVPNLEATAQQMNDCEDNAYQTWIEVKFKEDVSTKINNLSYQLGTRSERTFSSYDATRNVARINANAIDRTNPSQVLTIYYRDVVSATGQVISCSYTLIDPLEIENIVQLDEVEQVPNSTINTIEVTGKDGKAPYTYIFNGNNQGSNGVYLMKVTDPEEIGDDGKRYKIIEVTVYDAIGCTSTLTIKELYYDIVVPNFFTPDGDGNNDVWTPKYLEGYPHIRTHIFDRNGRRLRTLTQNETWDGMYQGKPLPSGDYWYIIDLNSDIDSRKFQGNFTLYR